MTTGRIVIIGAGQAGASAAMKLRALGHRGPLVMVGDETAPPYQRPPLSKKYLLGEMAMDRLLLRPEAFWAEQQIDLRLGQPVLSINRSAQEVRLGDDVLRYDTLVLATGAEPRRVPAAIGGDLPGVHVVRRVADIDALAPEMTPGRRLLVVGGGYIGLEAAAVARKLGLEVTVIEAAPRILGRVAAPETADFIRALHRRHEVEIIEGVGLDRLLGDTRLTGARLADGRQIAASLAVVGIGVEPSAGLAAAAGLPVAGGVVVDAFGRTADPAIWAAGDCTLLPFRGHQLRLESVQNAIDQAEAVAANILGAARPYHPKPWFWSDQYDLKLQIAGLNLGHDRVVIRPGPTPSHWYFAGDTLLAVDALGDARAYMIGKRLIEAGRSPDPAMLADPAMDLKSLL
ncbi:NAD(P)/FAD-dependent oxidoreductase [Gemmobacter sp.]|uniref:NAD(P)/FAD-dependent oxidoreductase n=1 Tax=Gemmobacter sp. TaxID=1898957 RepID=UPI002AFECB45|nr:FAD-dependent oxidoreductase [Gemmobacter sp.]